jgi:hypothetical protein
MALAPALAGPSVTSRDLVLCVMGQASYDVEFFLTAKETTIRPMATI